MSNKLYLNDRIELHSVFANTSNMTVATFKTNNDAMACTISKDDLNPPLLDVSSNPIYIVGINQQSGKECKVQWSNFASTTEFSITNTSTYSDWDMGYYKMSIRQYKTATNGAQSKAIDSGMYYELNKKPIFWNKSPLQFMTYINSGSFEIGCPRDEYGNENNNVTKRNLITIAKPFFIQRTHITLDLFNKVFQAVDPTSYSTYTWGAKDTFNTTAKNYICNKRYYDNGMYGTYLTGSSWKTFYPSSTNLSNITGYYTASYVQGGSTSNTFTLTEKSLNEVPTYLVNSIGKTASGGSNVYATHSFSEYFMKNMWDPDTNLSGYQWYIPTEAQWEYACRAGTLTGFNNGVNLENRYPSSATSADGNILEQNINEVAVWYKHIASVTGSAMFKPNKWGLYDMHGMLFEWVVDANGMDYAQISGSVYTPDGETNGTFGGSPVHKVVASGTANRGLRGGTYGNSHNLCARALRSAYRHWINPPYCSNYFGGRLSMLQV